MGLELSREGCRAAWRRRRAGPARRSRARAASGFGWSWRRAWRAATPAVRARRVARGGQSSLWS